MHVQRSLVLLKPDAVARRLVGQILARFEAKGLKIVGMKMLKVTPELSKQHYAEHVCKHFYPQLEQFITSGPVIALAVEGVGAIDVIRAMLGVTNGRESEPGTIRGDYGMSRKMNLVHASDGTDAAERELKIYFQPEELLDYASSLDPWISVVDEK